MTATEIERRLSSKLQSEEGIVAAYLFGGFAENRAHSESDVDVGVLLERSRHPTVSDRFEERLRLISRLGGTLEGHPIDLVVLNDAPPLLARRVVTAGSRFLLMDPGVERDFFRDVQLRAADLEPFLRRMRKIKLEGLAG